MKRWSVIIAVTVFVIFAALALVHDFVANHPIEYFAERPRRLLLVAHFAVVGGLIALLFDRLSPRLKRSVKLFILASVVSCLTVFTGYFLFEFARLSSQLGSPDGTRVFIVVPLCLGVVIALLGLEFHQVFKSRVD